MGASPIFIARNRDGELNASSMRCSHAGAHALRSSAAWGHLHLPLPRWTLPTPANLLKVKNPEGAGLPDCVNKEGSARLTKVASFRVLSRFRSAASNPDCRSLVEHLGEAAKIIDLIVDQSRRVSKSYAAFSTYSYDGMEAADRKRRRRIPSHLRAMNLRGDDQPPQQAESPTTSERHGCGQLGKAVGGGFLFLREWPPAAVDQLGQQGRRTNGRAR